jgi:hypothetical protein
MNNLNFSKLHINFLVDVTFGYEDNRKNEVVFDIRLFHSNVANNS